MLLSILITSHNQGVLLERCVNSILNQSLSIEYEIVISDDHSTDDTWELAQNLAKSHSFVKAIMFNSDDYHPVNRCQRCGWNQCNAYRNSKGKYFAHFDADDFFIEGTSVLMKQIELLELHPECSCCMANNYILNDGENVSQVVLNSPHSFETGYVLSSEEYIAKFWKSDHAFMYRRFIDEDPTERFGGYYDDTLITNYHLQFGDIVCLNDAGYVYVRYEDSIWNEIMVAKDVYAMLPIMIIPSLLPCWKNVYYNSRHTLYKLYGVVKLLLKGHKMEDGNLAYLRGMPNHNRLIGMMNRKLLLKEKIYLVLLIINLRLLKYFSFKPLFWFPKTVWID